ncbi:hypothetical protein LTR35_013533, partial [Friedmanniomyces endolithicus]
HLVPQLLVESGRVPGPGGAAAELPVDRRFARREDRAEEGRAEQQHDALQVSYHSELQQDVSEGSEPGTGDCGDQEKFGVCV